jgi:hypothetical protein
MRRYPALSKRSDNSRWRLQCAVVTIAIYGSSAGSAPSAPCPYLDLMPAYEEFAAATVNKPPEERAAAFLRQIADRFPDYYSSTVFGDGAKLQSRALQFFGPDQRSMLPGLPSLNPERLAALASVVGSEFAAQQRRFMQVFPDFTCDTTVEFGVSLMKFDGHPVDFAGTHHLLFGVDTIALLHVPADMPAFFDHEIFHLYHRQVIGSEAPQGEEPAWWTMWREGLATYVSQRMNSGLDAQQVLWYPRDMVTRMEKDLPFAARLMLQDIDKSGFEGDRWFLANRSVDTLPARAGYYLGYLFAKSEHHGEPLPQLARTSPEQVHADAVRFLRQLAHAPPAPRP